MGLKRANDFEDEVVRTASGGGLRLASRIGGGAEGDVYHVAESVGLERSHSVESSVVKIFKVDRRSDDLRRKIQVMIAKPPRDPTRETRAFPSIVWPTEVVENANSEFLGYQMPYLDLEVRKDALRYAREDLGWEQSTWDERYRTAINLATVVTLIHRQGHAIGDLNHQNIYVDGGYVSLVDCDSYHIRGPTREYTGSTKHKRYCPPTGRGETLADVRDADKFGLGIHIFQLLMGGYHPYQATGSRATSGDFRAAIKETPFPYSNPRPDLLEPPPSAPPYTELPAILRTRFEDCFGPGKRYPEERPTAGTWRQTLDAVRESTLSASDTVDGPPTDPPDSEPPTPTLNPSPRPNMEGETDDGPESGEDDDQSESEFDPIEGEAQGLSGLLFLTCGPGVLLFELGSLALSPDLFSPVIAGLSGGLSLLFAPGFLQPIGTLVTFTAVPALFLLGVYGLAVGTPYLPIAVVAYCGVSFTSVLWIVIRA